jgi:ribonuclease Z
MHITFCGTGFPVLNPKRACAGIVVQYDDVGFMLDCGPGTVQNAIASGVPLDQLRAVFLSHLHLDHVFCVPELLARLVLLGFPLPSIYGPSGTRKYMDSALDFTRAALGNMGGGLLQKSLDAVEVVETLPGDKRVVAGIHIQSEVVPHAENFQAQARRLMMDGLSIVYSGDARSAPEIMVDLARDADVLIHSCYTNAGLEAFLATLKPERADRIREQVKSVHCLLSDVARMAHEAGVHTLVLTHLLPTESEDHIIAEAKETFGGKVVVAHDGLFLKV